MFSLGINKIVIGATIIILLAFGVYYKTTQNRIELLVAQNSALEIAKKLQDATIKELELIQKINERASNTLNQRLQNAEAEKDELIARISSLTFNDENKETEIVDGEEQPIKNSPEVEVNAITNEIFDSIRSEFGP